MGGGGGGVLGAGVGGGGGGGSGVILIQHVYFQYFYIKPYVVDPLTVLN